MTALVQSDFTKLPIQKNQRLTPTWGGQFYPKAMHKNAGLIS